MKKKMLAIVATAAMLFGFWLQYYYRNFYTSKPSKLGGARK